jgi:protein-S-isoprenylcysteine O-methyltransferase Ste14
LGATCHVAFGSSIVVMIASRMRLGRGALSGTAAWAANGALALSFPFLHSGLLTASGARWLAGLSLRLGRELRSTRFALLASLHLIAVFALWSPAGSVLWRARGGQAVACNLAFAASWLLLGKAMLDAGLGVQTGWLGWSAVARGRAPVYPCFAARGLFRFMRQPIYVAFTCTLWTAPLLRADRLLLASVWTAYCLVGPLHKERRILARDPDGYGRYRNRVPYWLPRLGPLRPEL